MPEAVRILVAGAGMIGRAHVQRILAEPDAVLAGLVDPSPEAKTLAAELGVPCHGDFAQALAEAAPDGVVIATPNALHVPHGLAAVAARVPMLLEKPLADELAGARRLVDTAEAAGVPILVGHHRRHSPLIARARESIRAGDLGRVVAVNALCLFHKPDRGYFEGAGSWRREPGAGVVLINLIHVIDDLRNLCGDIVTVQAIASNAVRGFPVEDTAAVLLRFQNGALGTLLISDSAAAPWSWELTSGEDKAFPKTDEGCYLVAGTNASLSVPNLRTWRHEGDGWWRTPIHDGRLEATAYDPLTLQMRHFMQVIRGEAAPLVSGREALRTLEVTLAVKDAASAGGAVTLG